MITLVYLFIYIYNFFFKCYIWQFFADEKAIQKIKLHNSVDTVHSPFKQQSFSQV